MKSTQDNFARESRFAKLLYGDLSKSVMRALSELIQRHQVSVINGDVKYLDGGWYVTHSGLLRLAERRRCAGIHCRPVLESSDPTTSRWVFRAAVFKSRACRGFVGYGDADPSNVSFLSPRRRNARGRNSRRQPRSAQGLRHRHLLGRGDRVLRRTAPSISGSRRSYLRNRPTEMAGRTVRDRLCQVIRQHQLDPNLVKAYATDFCGVKTLRDATREQVENFVTHLADWAEKDRNALLCQLNSYPGQKEGAA